MSFRILFRQNTIISDTKIWNLLPYRSLQHFTAFYAIDFLLWTHSVLSVDGIAATTLPKIYYTHDENTKHMRRVARLVRVQKRLFWWRARSFISFTSLKRISLMVIVFSAACITNKVLSTYHCTREHTVDSYCIIRYLFRSLLVCGILWYVPPSTFSRRMQCTHSKFYDSYPYLGMITIIIFLVLWW